MRISFIHGQDSAKAYGKFSANLKSSKSKGFEIINIKDIKNITSISLFEDRTVFMLDKPSKVKSNDWKWLKKVAPKYNSNLLIFYDGDAPVNITRNLPKDVKIEKFDLPKIIFTFLDNFYPKNSKKSLKLLNDLSQNEPIELIFHLLARRLHDIYWILRSPDTLQMLGWQKSKLKNIADKFSEDKIKNAINKLSEVDVKSKTSSANLKDLLDMFIIEELK